MTKKSVFDQPGIEQLIPGAELPVGVKVTGRNLSAVSLLLSVSGEQRKTRTSMGAYFNEDGSLDHIDLHGEGGSKSNVKAGDYLTLSDDKSSIVVMDAEEYKAAKGFFGSLGDLDRLIATASRMQLLVPLSVANSILLG